MNTKQDINSDMPEVQESAAAASPSQERQSSDGATQRVAQLEDQLARLEADYANLKRRTEKDRVSWTKTAQTAVIEVFLDVVDDLGRALDASKTASMGEDVRSWVAGFDMIHKSLLKKLAELGVKKIDTTGAFNPAYHEALMLVASPQHTSGDIVKELSPGYIFGEAVIRHAKVSVAQ